MLRALPRMERTGLVDVDRLARTIQESVDAGQVGQPGDEFCGVEHD